MVGMTRTVTEPETNLQRLQRIHALAMEIRKVGQQQRLLTANLKRSRQELTRLELELEV